MSDGYPPKGWNLPKPRQKMELEITSIEQPSPFTDLRPRWVQRLECWIYVGGGIAGWELAKYLYQHLRWHE